MLFPFVMINESYISTRMSNEKTVGFIVLKLPFKDITVTFNYSSGYTCDCLILIIFSILDTAIIIF